MAGHSTARKIIDLFLLLAFYGAVAFVCQPSATTADARPYCNTQALTATIPYSTAAYQPLVYNFLGAPLRAQALQTETMNTDPDWQAYQQFKAWQAQQQQAAQSQQQTVQMTAQQWAVGWDAKNPAPAQNSWDYGEWIKRRNAAYGNWLQSQQQQAQPQQQPMPNTPPQAADPNAPWAQQQWTLVNKCGSCHSSDTANGKTLPDGTIVPIHLDGTTDLRAPESWRYRDWIMGAILDGRMPKKGELTGDDFGRICEELFAGRDAALTGK